MRTRFVLGKNYGLIRNAVLEQSGRPLETLGIKFVRTAFQTRGLGRETGWVVAYDAMDQLDTIRELYDRFGPPYRTLFELVEDAVAEKVTNPNVAELVAYAKTGGPQ